MVQGVVSGRKNSLFITAHATVDQCGQGRAGNQVQKEVVNQHWACINNHLMPMGLLWKSQH